MRFVRFTDIVESCGVTHAGGRFSAGGCRAVEAVRMPYHRRCHNTPPAHPPLTSTRAATTAHSPVGAVDGVSRPVWRARSLHAGRLPAHLRLVPTSADLRAPAPTQRSTCLLPLLSASALEAVTASASAAVTAAAASGRSVQKARGWKQFEPTSVSSIHCLCLCVASLSHYLGQALDSSIIYRHNNTFWPIRVPRNNLA